jgi:hypothetical protein
MKQAKSHVALPRTTLWPANVIGVMPTVIYGGVSREFLQLAADSQARISADLRFLWKSRNGNLDKIYAKSYRFEPIPACYVSGKSKREAGYDDLELGEAQTATSRPH